MRLGPPLTVLLAGTVAASCGGSECVAPEGCLRASGVSGTCQCAEWRTVSVETVPIKFVVLSVDYGVLGSQTEIVYGYSSGANMLPAFSELGSRFRALVRKWDGTEEVLALGAVADEGALLPVTQASLAFWLVGGDGKGSGGAWGRSSSYDIPSRARDAITVWVNPTVTVTTNFVGDRRVNWGWTGVGGCFSPFGCYGPRALTLSVEEIDGTIPAWDSYAQPFLATLTPDERAAIVKYDAFNDPPGRDPATFATDPRFQLLGPASLSVGAASYPTATWMPCAGSLTDASFEPLAESEVYFPFSSRALVLQHGVLSHQATCVSQESGLAMGTATPGCEITSLVYVDRIFGTLLFAPETATPSCTSP